MISASVKLLSTSAMWLNLLCLSVAACSLADGYLRPPTYDLVKDTEAIVFAETVSEDKNQVSFKVNEVLKGDFHATDFRGTGRGGSLCFPYDFWVSYGHRIGTRQIPAINVGYLLFLSKTRTGWEVWDMAQSRMNDPVYDRGSPFLMTVRHYIRISSINNYETEKKELRKLQEAARRKNDTLTYPSQLIVDIDEYFRSPTSKKSFNDLLEIYKHSSKEARRKVLWAFAWGKHSEAADFVEKMLNGALPSDYLAPLSKFVEQTRNEALLTRLAKNYPRLERRIRWPVMWALINAADAKHIELMLAALRSADKEEAGRIAEWFVRHPAVQATGIVRTLVGTDYEDNWELSLSLAGMGDRGTLDCARRFMNSAEKNRWKALYTIARSPLVEADELARNVIKRNDTEDLISLIQGYKESQNPNRWARLRDLIDLRPRDSKLDYWLRITLEEMAQKGDSKSAELLKTLQL